MKDEFSQESQDLLAFANSARGQLLISQALSIAIKVMDQVEPEEVRERSNIEDMKLLYTKVFPLYAMVEEMKEKYDSTPDFVYNYQTGETAHPGAPKQDDLKKENEDGI